MHKFFLACLFLTLPCLCLAKEPRNLDLDKAALIHYHDSHEYENDQAAVIQKAIDYLKSHLSAAPRKKLAIVLDIDETSLSNYPNMLALRFGGTQEDITRAENLGKDPAIKPTLKLYRLAKAEHIKVFFVSGRKESAREATARNLIDQGFRDWDGLIMRPEDYSEKSVVTYKMAARKELTKHGYRILLNVGDQASDFKGGLADKTFKLPNPFYLIP